MNVIDFRSDTVTHPTPAMRQAMFEAAVGDDVYQDDPTTNELERLAAEMLGMEAALFVPSGTMGNQLAVMTHTRRGDEAIVSIGCHIFEHEVGAASALSGVTLHPLTFPNGVYDAAMIEGAIRSDDIHEPPTTLICLENALANGRVVPVETMREIREMAKAAQTMVTEAVDAYVKQDLDLARKVMAHDDVVDDYFTQVKKGIIDIIAAEPSQGEYALDLLMIAKYFERIGDHCTNIAEWVEFSVTGVHKDCQ